jgi:N-acetylmuramoyl-L-alanine amidase
MLNNSKPIGSYIELGNINHELDQKRLLIVDNRQAVANWLMLGIIKDFENSKKK